MIPIPQRLTPIRLTCMDPEVIRVSNPLLWVSLNHSLILLNNTHCAQRCARPTERNNRASLPSRSPWPCEETDLSWGCRCVFGKHRRARGAQSGSPRGNDICLCWVWKAGQEADRTGAVGTNRNSINHMEVAEHTQV